MTYLQGECSCTRADWFCRLNVGRVVVMNNPPPRLPPLDSPGAEARRQLLQEALAGGSLRTTTRTKIEA